MSIVSQREVIVEYERVQLIRKRANTQLMACTHCGIESDFVSLDQAAQLFETAECKLLGFINENSCHFQTSTSGQIHICLTALLKKMQQRSNTLRLASAPSEPLGE